MTQDEIILTLLRAVARSMVCEKCGGTGIFIRHSPEYPPGKMFVVDREHPMPVSFEETCSCRTAIRDLLAPKGV